MKTSDNSSFDEKYDLEMESIYMAWEAGVNFPPDRLTEAFLYLKNREKKEEEEKGQ